MKADSKVGYYALMAQLNGGGDINCRISVGGKVIKKGHASGSYNICHVQIAPGLLDGWDAL